MLDIATGNGHGRVTRRRERLDSSENHETSQRLKFNNLTDFGSNWEEHGGASSDRLALMQQLVSRLKLETRERDGKSRDNVIHRDTLLLSLAMCSASLTSVAWCLKSLHNTHTHTHTFTSRSTHTKHGKYMQKSYHFHITMLTSKLLCFSFCIVLIVPLWETATAAAMKTLLLSQWK